MMEITIDWINERPYFILDDEKGDCILLNFGLDYIDDIEIDYERFFIYLQKDGVAWKANRDTARSFGIIHGDMINDLLAKINNALETRADFDIIEYVMANKKDYAFLHRFVCWIDKYR